MKRAPHKKLTKHEFIMLRSLAIQGWQSTNPVLWRNNRSWREGYYGTAEARLAAESLLRRGLVDCQQLKGFIPLRPGEPVRKYWLNARGEALLNKANGRATSGAVLTAPSLIYMRTAKPRGSLWGRLLHTLRRRRPDADKPSSQSNR
jgi:hypothetical protein